MRYQYFELGKNADPEREDSPQFRSALAVHPVSEPSLMYRLHKRFSQLELEWTYQQIEQLQVGSSTSSVVTLIQCVCVSHVVVVGVGQYRTGH